MNTSSNERTSDARGPRAGGVASRAIPAPAKAGFGLPLWALWLYLLISVAKIGDVYPILGQLHLGKLAIAVALIAWLSNAALASRVPFFAVPTARYASWLMALAVLTLPFAIYKSHSLQAFVQPILVVATAFVLMIKMHRDWRSLRVTMWVLVACGAFLAFMALLSYAGGRAEVRSQYYDTNGLAYLLVTLLPIALCFSATSSGLRRAVYALITVAFVVTILLTSSRGGFLGLLGAALVIVVQPVAETSAKAKARGSRFVARAVMVAVAGLIIWTQLPDASRERLATVLSLSGDYNMDESNKHGRVAIWKRNLKAALHRPIGYGIESFNTVDLMYGGKYRSAHNSVLQIIVELGVLGLIVFLRLYWIAWRELGAIGKRDAPGARQDPESIEHRVFARGLRATLVANFIAGFFLSMAYSNILWSVFAVIGVLIALSKNPSPEPVRSGAGRVQKAGDLAPPLARPAIGRPIR